MHGLKLLLQFLSESIYKGLGKENPRYSRSKSEENEGNQNQRLSRFCSPYGHDSRLDGGEYGSLFLDLGLGKLEFL